jgi:hypothetical protein
MLAPLVNAPFDDRGEIVCVRYGTKIRRVRGSLHAFFRVRMSKVVPRFSPRNRAKQMGSQASQSRELRWRRLYEAAVLEVDQKILPRRVRVAKRAILLQIVRSHKVDEAGELWGLMHALNVLDDLLKMNQADLPRRA